MITQELKQIIQENKNLINQNTKESWEEVYTKKIYTRLIGEFTEMILDAGINDPASIMGYIPKYYLYNRSKIKNYIIPSNVTSIGHEAFESCSSLVSIEIPDSVKTIGDRAFAWGSSLTSMAIPDSVKTIGKYVFFYCENLTSIEIGGNATIGDGAFYGCSNLKEIHYKGTKEQALTKLKIKNKKWRGGSSIEKVICIDGVIEL